EAAFDDLAIDLAHLVDRDSFGSGFRCDRIELDRIDDRAVIEHVDDALFGFFVPVLRDANALLVPPLRFARGRHLEVDDLFARIELLEERLRDQARDEAVARIAPEEIARRRIPRDPLRI